MTTTPITTNRFSQDASRFRKGAPITAYVEVSLQFFQDKDSLLEVLDALDHDILKWLEVRGIKNEVKAIVK